MRITLFIFLFLSSCTVYQNSGRKDLESHVLRSPNVNLANVSLLACNELNLVTKALSDDLVPPETEILHADEVYEVWYKHPGLMILSKEENLFCKYSVTSSTPLNDSEISTLIRGLYETTAD